MPKCLICEDQYQPFMSFGRMPLANGFLTAEQFADEYFYELKIGFCPACKMVQLAELVDPEKMFHANYPFYSSTSTRMAAHFGEFAELVMAKYLNSSDPFVVEMGSNDGIMLQHFAGRQIRHLGVEPSGNVAQRAVEKGIQTICRFFDQELARDIVAEQGQADVLLGANVMCHIPDLHSVAAAVRILLKPGGFLLFEDPYLGDTIEKTAYDQIYDEHAFYFSVSSVSYLFEQHGLEVIDVLAQPVHGGSMRYVIAPRGTAKVSERVLALRAREEELGVHKAETYERFRCSVERSRDELVRLLRALKEEGKRVVGYAATSKSTTVINYCGLTSELVEFISDTTPAKQGKFTPGAHIPVKPHKEFTANYPDYALLFGWNHAEEIMGKEQEFKANGGKWIVYVPGVQVI
ncbi:class I SAM-dependent methyltransferase [Acidobacteria bacterium AH-259-O06]|nr:class I SAM-dependent methyltransferase [Acidobacteria bacterium AH-259-O06]